MSAPTPHPEQVEAAREVLAATYEKAGLSGRHVREPGSLPYRDEIAVQAMLSFASLANRPADTEWPEQWAGPLTVGNMIANLRTLPADMPIHSAYHLIREGQPTRLFVKHPTVSRERVDGREIKQGDESVPYSAVIWSHERDPGLANRPADDGGWIVGNGDGGLWRTWGVCGPDWTPDRDKATRYHRREDAEIVHAEDEDAWRVEPYAPPQPEGVERP